jgi:hypothetical protein
MSVALVTMVLAYAPGRPDGDVADRVEMKVALTPQGQPDEAAWFADPAPWPFRRRLPNGTERSGEVVVEEGSWALRVAHTDDAPLWTMAGRVFRPGELVTLRRPTAEELVFRVVNVEAG